MSTPEFSEKIHLLDISSKLPGYKQCWSPNTLKTRLLLNAKGIPYTEQYVSYPDIAPLLKSYGVPPNESGYTFTLPAIYHPETLKDVVPGGKVMTESTAIAHHLDKLYPSTAVQAFPEPKDKSEALWKDSEHLLRAIVFPAEQGKGFRLLMPKIPLILDDRGSEYFIRTRAATHPEHLSPLKWGSENPEDDWRAIRASVFAYIKFHESTRSDAIASGYGQDGPFLWGNKVTMGDIYLASILVWFRSGGEEMLNRFLAIGEKDEPAARKSDGEQVWEKSPIRGVWEAFGREGWLEAVGEPREIPSGSA
ncbi:hypothetical protein QFC22_003388 [Naganishia vaughanmartiniae]|uniref:Uncharacterized protein n=1 Tax=Naganishia vaughanmartiniae TaxID=1424756 RepID=A0ACC2X6N1_9TREE|nr:hypothetical protein QFC22_003388 [Naganishia vaughanmartiniae]